MVRTIALLVSSLILACGPAFAGKAPTKKVARQVEGPMQVHVVRSAQPGCEPTCPEWIAAQGTIDAGALKQFKKVLSQLRGRKLPVFIHSTGGLVHEAFAIGRLVRANGLDVAVTKTKLTRCAPADAACRKSKSESPDALRGVAQAPFSICASACAFVLAAGERRFVGPLAFVGVHQIKTFQTYTKVLRTYRFTARPSGGGPAKIEKKLISERTLSQKTVQAKTTKSTYDEIKQYFVQMGIAEAIMPLLLATPHANVHWLTQDELRSTRIATDRQDGQQLLAGATAPLPDGVGPAQAGTVPEAQVMGLICQQFAGAALGCPANQTPSGSDAGVPVSVPAQLAPGASPK